jgi:hypothetical protein
MSRVDAPLTLLDRALQPRQVSLGMDEALQRRLERALRRVEPDPLFKRRLRGHVLNGYVAAREGLIAEPRRQRRMGTLGRSVLYASLALAMSVSAAGAAAQDSLPGDALYGLKLQLEDVRMRIAPHAVRVELAEIALAERIEELERLAASGSWSLVAAAAARVSEAEDALAEIDPESAAPRSVAVASARQALEKVMAKAPPPARGGLERALQAVGPRALQPDRLPPGHPLHPEHAQPTNPNAGDSGGGADRGGAGVPGVPNRPTQQASPSPSPSPDGEQEQDQDLANSRGREKGPGTANSPRGD